MQAAGFFGAPVMVPNEPALLPLTDGQRELWLAAEANLEASCAFNESCALKLTGKFKIDAFRMAVRELVGRHEALRTTFDRAGRGQIIHADMAVDVPLIDLTELSAEDCDAEVLRLLEAEDGEPFDLTQGPLLRIKVVRIREDLHLVLMTAHHIAVDG